MADDPYLELLIKYEMALEQLAYVNEDGVPINETDAMALWRSYAHTNAIHTSRIENIGTSLPDLFMLYKGVIVFQELKVRRGNIIYAPSYQWAGFNKLARELREWQLVYVVYNKGGFDLYEYAAVLKLPETHIKGTAYGKVSINIKELVPFMRVANSDDFYKYIEYVHLRAFRKPKT